MSEKDLDIAIEKCKRIMKFDTRTLENPESENGHIFEKVYDLLQFLSQFQFATETNVATTDVISRQAAIDCITYDMEYTVECLKALPPARPSVSKTEIVGDVISRQAAINTVRKAKDKSEAHRMLVQLPTAQPDREKIDEYLLKIWGLEHPLSSATTTIELRWWIKKIYEEIYGEGEKPIWMT